MLRKFLPFFLLALMLWVSAPAAQAETVNPGGGVFSQIVGGGPWTLVMTLLNLDALAVTYQIQFIGDDGNPLSLATTIGTGSTLNGSLNSGGSIIIQSAEPAGGPIKEGYAIVTATETSGGQAAYLGGSVVYRLTEPNSPIYEASLPLDTGQHYQFALPVDEVNSDIGIALANSDGASPLSVTFQFYDLTGDAGTPYFQDTITMASGTHMSFMLSQMFPVQTNGKQGLWLISGSYYMNILGLRVTNGGFTSIAPLILPGW